MADEILAVDKTRTALVLVHMQRDIVGGDGKGGPDGIVEPDAAGIGRIQTALTAAGRTLQEARRARLPVFHVAWGRPANGSFANRHGRLFEWNNRSGMAVEGTRGHEFCDPVTPEADETVHNGGAISGFAASRLGSFLTTNGIDTVAVAGIPTQWAVESTVRDAADRGYRIVVLEDCCASGTLRRHEAAMENMRWLASVVPSKAFCDALASGA